jgi:TRAP-type C4-dicarboxylate transport system permease large subunit
LYILVLAAVRRKISFKKVFNEGVVKSIIPISQIMFILALASALGWLLAREQVYIVLAEVIKGFCGESALMFWLVVNVFYLLNGCLVPGIATMVITVPLFAPLLPYYHIDPIQFGVVIIFNDMIGMITPPVGSGIFVMLSVGKVRYDELIKDLLPFVLVLLLALLVLVAVPQITLFFPNLILGPAGGGP